jgi:hypothetical protein
VGNDGAMTATGVESLLGPQKAEAAQQRRQVSSATDRQQSWGALACCDGIDNYGGSVAPAHVAESAY